MSLRFLLPSTSSVSLLWGLTTVSMLPFAVAKADDTTTTTVQPVIVSATRIATPASEVASSVTLVTSDEIEAKQERTLHDILQDVPGVFMPSYGGPGTASYLFTRGTNPNHTKILVDGIDVSDPAQSDGSTNLENILAGDIERVEMLRGPQSGLYGSDAIGGVLNIVTKKGSGPAQITGSIEGGSFATFNQTAAVSGSTDRVNYAFNVGHFSTQDEVVQPANAVQPGAQRLNYTNDNKTASGKFGVNVTDNLDLGLVVRGGYSELTDLSDNRPYTPYMGDAHNYQTDTQFMARGTVHQTLFDGLFDQTLGLSEKHESRHYAYASDNGQAPNVFGGDRVKGDWQGNIKLAPGQVLTLGAEREQYSISDLKPEKFTTNSGNTAGFTQLQSKFGSHFADSISLRHDENDQFGSANTYRVAPVILLPETDSKIKGSVGTGFKAPTLDQLYNNYPSFNFYANPNLKPEKSLGWDSGFEQELVSGKVSFGSTYFHNNIKNLIASFVNAQGVYGWNNVSSATTSGFENFVSYVPAEGLTIRADYTRTLTENLQTHHELVERPKNKAGLSTIWQATDDLRISVNLTGVTDSYSYYDAKVGGWWTANVAANYRINETVSVFGRVDNILDRTYAEQGGYLAPGVGAFAGVKLTY